MKVKKTAVYVFCLFFIIFSVKNLFAKEYVFVEALTCKDIAVSDGFPIAPIETTDKFIDTDNYVFTWIRLEQIRKSLNVKFEWYNPQNNFIARYFLINADPLTYGYEYWEWYNLVSYLNIARVTENYPDMNIYGKWRIDIYIDDNKISTLFFTIDPAFAQLQLYFPLRWSSPYSADISSVLDHSGNFYERDGSVLAYTGEKARKKYGADCYDKYNGKCTKKSKIWGYKKRNQSAFSIFGQGDYLWHDGHSGYDYPADAEDDINAPARGTLCVSTTKTSKSKDGKTLWRNKDLCPYGNDPINGKNGKKTSWDGWHAFYIVHEIENYTTWYLHGSDIDETIKDEILENGYAYVFEKDTIAYVGHFGLKDGDHLHFEVRKGDREVIDPYGWGAYPVLWIDGE